MMWDTFSALPTIIFTNRKNAIPVMKSRSFIYISLGVDIIVAASKFIAAAITGSSAMLSEGPDFIALGN
jgi:divalent metal cation (Fe/Co/Zn/Cd) transporter